jgi:hypothetical protein
MTTRRLIITIVASFIILSGCGYSLVHVDPDEKVAVQVTEKDASDGIDDETSRYYYTTQSPSPIALTHADIAKKKIYISRVKETLINFCLIARDTGRRENELFVKEIGREANSFVKIYVEPIVNDSEAVRNLETKAEIAKLQFLSASLYFELAGYFQAKFYLERLSGQYENDFLSSVTMNQNHMGYSTVAEGITDLQKRIALKQMTTAETM